MLIPKPGTFTTIYVDGDISIFNARTTQYVVDSSIPIQITLPSLANTINGYYVYFYNNGPNTVDIYPFGTDTINASVPISLVPSVCVQLISDFLQGLWVVVIDTTALVSTGTVTSVTNAAAGNTLVLPPFTTTPSIKTLVAGSNIDLDTTTDPNSIIINSTAPEFLEDLADVDITSPVNKQALVYNGVDWINANVVNSVNNITLGNTLVVNGGTANPTVKSLVAGSGIAITTGANTLTIDNTGVVNLTADNDVPINPIGYAIKISGSSTNSRSGITTGLGTAPNIMQLYNTRDVSPYVVYSNTAPYNTKFYNAYSSIVSAYNAAIADGFGLVDGSGNNLTPINILVTPGVYDEGGATLALRGGINIISVGGYNSVQVSNLFIDLNPSGNTLIENINFILTPGVINVNSTPVTATQSIYFKYCNWTTSSLTDTLIFLLDDANGRATFNYCNITAKNNVFGGIIVLDNNYNIQVINTTYNVGLTPDIDIFILGTPSYTVAGIITDSNINGVINSSGTSNAWVINNTYITGTLANIFGTGPDTTLLATSNIYQILTFSGGFRAVDCIFTNFSTASSIVSLFNCQILGTTTLGISTTLLCESLRCIGTLSTNAAGLSTTTFINSYFSASITLNNPATAGTAANTFMNCKIDATVFVRNGSGTSIANSSTNNFSGCVFNASPCFNFNLGNTTKDYAILYVVNSSLRSNNEMLVSASTNGNHQISFISDTIISTPNVSTGIFDIASSGVFLNLTSCTLAPNGVSNILLYTDTLQTGTNTTTINECDMRQCMIKNMYATSNISCTNTVFYTGGFDGNENNTASTFTFTITSCMANTILIKAGNSSTGTFAVNNSVITSANSTSLVGITPTSITANIFNSVITNGWDASNASNYQPITLFAIALFNVTLGATQFDLREASINKWSILFNDSVFNDIMQIRLTNTTTSVSTTIRMYYCTSITGIPEIISNNVNNNGHLVEVVSCGFLTPTTGSGYSFKVFNNTPNNNSRLTLTMADTTIARFAIQGNVEFFADTCSFVSSDVSSVANSHTVAITNSATVASPVFSCCNCLFNMNPNANNTTSDIINLATGAARGFRFVQCVFSMILNAGNDAGRCINIVNAGTNANFSSYDGCNFISTATSPLITCGFDYGTLAGSTVVATDYYSNCTFKNENVATTNLITYLSASTLTGRRFRQANFEQSSFTLVADSTATAATAGLIQFSTQSFMYLSGCVLSAIRQNIITLTTSGIASTTETGTHIINCIATSNFDASPRLVSWNSTTTTTTAILRIMANTLNIGSAASALLALPAASTIGIANIASNILINSNVLTGITQTAVGTSF